MPSVPVIVSVPAEIDELASTVATMIARHASGWVVTLMYSVESVIEDALRMVVVPAAA